MSPYDDAPPEFDEPCPDCEPGWTCSPCLATLRETDGGLTEAEMREGK